MYVNKYVSYVTLGGISSGQFQQAANVFSQFVELMNRVDTERMASAFSNLPGLFNTFIIICIYCIASYREILEVQKFDETLLHFYKYLSMSHS